jgi:hypothetical protein
MRSRALRPNSLAQRNIWNADRRPAEAMTDLLGICSDAVQSQQHHQNGEARISFDYTVRLGIPVMHEGESKRIDEKGRTAYARVDDPAFSIQLKWKLLLVRLCMLMFWSVTVSWGSIVITYRPPLLDHRGSIVATD